MAISIIIGGQYGSEGKGKISSFWADKCNAVAAVRVGGPNSGHTVYDEGGRRIPLSQLPTACIKRDILAILPAGSYIDISTLQSEIERIHLSPDRLKIDPNAVVVDDFCKQAEKNMLLKESIGSTISGTGKAVSARVMRNGKITLASSVPCLEPYITNTKSLMRSLLTEKKHIIIEGTQGYGLSNLHSGCYPYATSRDTTAAGFLSEAGLSPFDVEHIVMVIRAFPIRVAGNSGPLPNEITWDVVTQESGSKTRLFERTTVTNRIRRVARFDSEVISDAIIANRPNVIVLNHVDYFDMKQHGKKTLSKRQLNAISSIEKAIGSRIDYVGNGPDNIISL